MIGKTVYLGDEDRMQVPRNLKLLGRRGRENESCVRCGRARCQIFSFMSESNSFRSNVTGSACKSSNVTR